MNKNVVTSFVVVILAIAIIGSFILGNMKGKKTASVEQSQQAMLKQEDNEEGTNVGNADNLKKNSQIESGINPGQKAIDFTLTNSQGQEVSLSDYAGKKVLVNFWASWCPPCRQEMPEFEAYAKENPDVVILGVNIDANDQKASADKIVADLGITYPIVYGTQELGGIYQVQYLPTNLFIDENGVIQQKLVGAISKDVLAEEFNKY